MATGELQITAAKPQLLEMVDDKSRNVQVAVRFALHRLGDTTYSHDLESTSRSPERSVRANTAVVLGLLGEPSAINILKGMQRDSDSSVRIQAAEAMWRLGSKDGLDSLVAISLSRYPDDQMIAYMALAAPRDKRVIQHIRLGLVSQDNYVEVTLVAARAMGLLGSDEGYGLAIKATSSVDPRQRSLAALALGAIARSDAQAALAQLLKDSDPEVRLSAATAILQLKEKGDQSPEA
jgi:HEAT repeat protein